jgi:hypothetical protein
LRPGDTLARLGGDEFTVLLDSVGSEADATGVAERIHQELAAPLIVRGYEMFTSVSVGIALSSAGYDRPEDMLRDADTAMYRAKAGGRARHQVFAGDMHQRAVSSLRLETDLRRALQRREIVPFYQPIVNLDDGAVVGFEALARWQHPTLGLLPPDLFIPVAEETGLVGAIGEWMLTEACRQAREWQRKHPRRSTLGISVNVSGRQLAQGDVAADVKRALSASGLDPACLTLEITESALMHNLKAGAGVIQRLHAMSVGPAPGRLRHRLLVARVPAQLPVARAQGRSIVRQQDGSVAAAVGDRQGDRIAGTQPRDGGDRRGSGDARAGQGPAAAQLPSRAGLPVLAARPRRGGRTAPHPRRPEARLRSARRALSSIKRDMSGSQTSCDVKPTTPRRRMRTLLLCSIIAAVTAAAGCEKKKQQRPTLEPVSDRTMGYEILIPKGAQVLQKEGTNHTYSLRCPTVSTSSTSA